MVLCDGCHLPLGVFRIELESPDCFEKKGMVSKLSFGVLALWLWAQAYSRQSTIHTIPSNALANACAKAIQEKHAAL